MSGAAPRDRGQASPPAEITLHSLGRSAEAPIGNNCAPNPDGSVGCTDACFPGHPTSNRLPVRPKGLLRIRSRVGAPAVFIRLLDGVKSCGQTEGAVGPPIHAERAALDDRHWTVRLPDPLRPAGAVAVVFNNGVNSLDDRMYYARIRRAHGRLEITQTTDTSAGVYEEGAISFLRLEATGGQLIFERGYQERAHIRLTRRLPVGRYRLASYQRPCMGNCDTLGPPRDRCSTRFSLRDRQRLQARIRVKPFDGCSIRL